MMNKRLITQGAAATTGAGVGKGTVLSDLKTFFEALVSDGEELQIRSAKIFLTVLSYGTANTTSNRNQLVVMIADGGISTANGPGSDYSVDKILDEMTSGDFEFKLLGESFQPAFKGFSETAASTFSVVASSNLTLDITDPVRKIVKRLIEPVTTTGPAAISLVLVSGPNAAAATEIVNWSIQMDYVVRPRIARML